MVKNKNCAGQCDGKCCGNCADEAARIQQRIFEREVDEELRQEQLAKMWKKYRFVVYAGVIGVILGTMAVEWYGAWRAKVSMAESDRYEQAEILSVQGQTDDALMALAELVDTGRTGYRYLAQLRMAGILFKSGDTGKALTFLKMLSNNQDAPKAMRSVALLSFVGHQIETAPAAELKQLLAPMVSDTKDAFYGMAVELSALIDLNGGNPKQAAALLNTALQTQDLAPQMRERLTLLKGSI